ncbi:MAG: right-handed parallel beta-helix repeat-containing protein [Pleurocapsa minor GSE-CHR-MK-17-07R]|jgi:hypothetical protein|nr:right-handed parallel beta-helix repeat-containing protein [Pleurocapsa minor GSE-CHR-MK 17-07R]
MNRLFIVVIACLMLLVARHAVAQSRLLPPYDIGTPDVAALYVSPQGDDNADGTAAESAVRSLSEALRRIPRGEDLTQGVHIFIAPGDYSTGDLTPHYIESIHGTASAPVIIEASGGQDTVFLAPLNLFDARYVYLLNVNVASAADPFHCEQCDHLLLRGNTFTGSDPETYETQETVKINQSTNIYVEDNLISGAWDNAVDFVAVQGGHFIGNRIFNAGDWCMYLKGGSADFIVTANEIFDCGTGGFTAGQGTGFQFMTPPYLQYEAYDIAFIDNLIHDTQGAGIGVQGGYRILVAANTMVEVGARSHLLEVVHGHRSCDGQPGDEGRDRCEAYLAAGGWGTTVVDDGTNYVRIPNREVVIANNIVVNTVTPSAYQVFTIFGPFDDAPNLGSGVPSPALADEALYIVGNAIWNAGEARPLGIEPGFESGCAETNPTCNLAQVGRDNSIDALANLLANPSAGDYSLTSVVPAVPVPAFAPWDVPVPETDSVRTALGLLAAYASAGALTMTQGGG